MKKKKEVFLILSVWLVLGRHYLYACVGNLIECLVLAKYRTDRSSNQKSNSEWTLFSVVHFIWLNNGDKNNYKIYVSKWLHLLLISNGPENVKYAIHKSVGKNWNHFFLCLHFALHKRKGKKTRMHTFCRISWSTNLLGVLKNQRHFNHLQSGSHTHTWK